MGRIVFLIIVLGIFVPQLALGEPDTCPKEAGRLGDLFSSDPTKLAASWIKPLERLYSAIPSLSPREKQWLDAEMRDLNRAVHAVRSREYALKESKLNVGSLLGSLRVLGKVSTIKNPWTPVRDWSFLAYTLIEYDAALYLARLESDGVIPRAAIPQIWVAFGGTDYPLDDSIRVGRTLLARHILICIIPKAER